MIIAQTDLKTYFTTKGTLDSVIKVHAPTNVFFEKIFDGDTFQGFVVASYDKESNEVKEKKEFSGVDDKSFYEAVDYFEKLIEQKSPKEEQNKQDDFESFGKFIYYKTDKISRESFIKLDQPPTAIFIPKADVSKVFTPPQTKKYGRLDMTVLDDPKYDMVRSKFALKYNEEESIEACSNGGVDLSEIRIYDLMPYSNGTEEEGEEQQPQDVNQNSLSTSEIEGEEPQQRPPKNEQERQEQEKEAQQQDAQNQDSESDSGEPDQPQPADQTEDGEPQPTDQTGEGEPQPTDQTGEGEPQPIQIGNEGEIDGEPDLSGVAINMDLIEAFNKQFKTDDILSTFKTESRFMSAIALLGEDVRKYAPLLKIDKNAPITTFYDKIKEEIRPFYNK